MRLIDGVRTMRREDLLRPIYLYLPKPFYRNALNVGTSPPTSNTYSQSNIFPFLNYRPNAFAGLPPNPWFSRRCSDSL